ncbi:MAG: T9SS type A sorting domain-containing protein [Rhodothermales bacterium]|nr:T9SS type A sorting domain-containing protein [Rhodothermales bacterium]
MLKVCSMLTVLLVALLMLPTQSVQAQQKKTVRTSENRPSRALREMAATRRSPAFTNLLYEVPNKTRGESTRTIEKGYDGPDPVLQSVVGNAPGTIDVNFDGADNNDNQDQVGFRVAPPDTDGDVGPNHYVQMVNLVGMIFDKGGNLLVGPFPNNLFFEGFGGICETTNQGDPVVLYDETADRWLVSQFAFDDAFTVFAQCVAISQTADPTGEYNRYEFDFTDIGFPDYPKHGVMSDSYTLMVNVFEAPLFFFSGTGLAALDRDAMLAGQPATMAYFGLGASEFGFVAGDIDGASVDMPPTFATAMSNTNQFDVWEIDVDWSNPGAASISQVASIPVSAFDQDLCTATREACITSTGGTAYEAIADRLMHRLNIRDFGTHQSMVTTHTVDVGSGRAGIRWYEMRNTGSGWSLYQEGTFAPSDGHHRWMGSAAINAAGDIAVGYSVSSSTLDPEIRFTGQTAASSGSGTFDVDETTIITSTDSQTGTARWGDYSSMSVDPIDDRFWYTQEYTSANSTTSFHWATRIASFSFEEGTTPEPPDAAPTNLVASALSTSDIDLTWDDNASNETGYEVERCTGSGCSGWALIATTGAGSSSYSDSGLNSNTTYNYRTRAVNTVGQSAYSNESEATTDDDVTPPADDLVVVVTPIGDPIVLPSTGGRYEFVIDITNNGSATVTKDYWDVTTDPNGAQSTPRRILAATIAPGATFSATLRSRLSRRSPAGTYVVAGHAGDYPTSEASDSFTLVKEGTSAPDLAKTSTDVPEELTLGQNYPNPFNPSTTIRYGIPQDGAVSIRVYNVMGREVATLVNDWKSAGTYEVAFDASRFSAGVYLFSIDAGGQTIVNRMTLLK